MDLELITVLYRIDYRTCTRANVAEVCTVLDPLFCLATQMARTRAAVVVFLAGASRHSLVTRAALACIVASVEQCVSQQRVCAPFDATHRVVGDFALQERGRDGPSAGACARGHDIGQRQGARRGGGAAEWDGAHAGLRVSGSQ